MGKERGIVKMKRIIKRKRKMDELNQRNKRGAGDVLIDFFFQAGDGIRDISV